MEADSSSPWQDPGQADAPTARRAALLLWVLGLVQSIGGGVLVLGMLAIASDPPPELHQMADEARRSGVDVSVEAIIALSAVIAGVLIVLPGLAYFGLGFGVRRGKPLAIGLAVGLVVTQIVVFSLMLLSEWFSAVGGGSPVHFTVATLMWGTPIAVLGFTAALLLRLRRARVAASTNGPEPWETAP